jgi:hypothetical protein
MAGAFPGGRRPIAPDFVISFQYPYRKDVYDFYGATVIAMGGKHRRLALRFWLWVQVWRKLIGLKKHYQLKGLLSFWMGECALVGRWFSTFSGIRHYCWMMGQDARPGNHYVKRARIESIFAHRTFRQFISRI